MTPQKQAEIVGYAKAGNMITAIKEYRAVTGVGLAEAKAAVEAMVAGAPPAHSAAAAQSSGNPSLERVRDALVRGNKIEAIRVYRELTGVGLAEAKEQVDQLERNSPGAVAGKPGVQKEGCFSLFILGPTGLWGLLELLSWVFG